MSVRYYLWISLSFSLLILFAYPALSQVNSDGIPYVQNYSPRTYSAAEANWSITQDNRGVMYFGNSQAILEYDGYSWNKIPVPGQTYISSLAAAPNGTIYVGGIDDFGQLVVNENGQLEYKSLAFIIEDSVRISRTWKIYTDSNFVYFCTLQHIFKYDPVSESIHSINLPKDSFWSFLINNQLYTGNYTEGLLHLDKNSFVSAKGADFFKNKDIFSILPWASDTLLVATAQNGLVFYLPKTGQVSSFNFSRTASKTNELLVENSLYVGIKIDENHFAFGTLVNGLYIINKKGEIKVHVNEELGLQNEIVTNLFYSSEESGVLWLSLVNGISSVNITSPVRLFAGESGLNGAVHAITRYNNTYYAATVLGVFKLETSTHISSGFTPVDGISGEQVYSMLCFKPIEGGEKLLIASVRDVYHIDKDEANRIFFNQETYSLIQSKIYPNTIYVATSRGVRLIEFRNNKFVFDDNTLGAENETVTKITEDSKGNLWCNTLSGQNYILNREGNSLEIPDNIQGKTGRFFSFNDDIFFITDGLVLVYNQDSHSFSQYHQLNALYHNNRKKLREIFFLNDTSALASFFVGEDPKNDIIYYSNNTWINDTLSLRIIPPMTVYTASSDNTYTLVGGQEGLFIHNKKREKDFYQNYKTLIRSVVIGTDSIIFKGGGGLFEQYIDNNLSVEQFHTPIDYRFNNIIFTFSATFFEAEKEMTYSYFLEGFDRHWSAWLSDISRNYTNLKEGTYRFHVKAKNIYGVESEVAVFEFRILPPWYRTWWAYLIYIVLGLITIWLSIAGYTRKLQEDKRRLESIVRERTAEIVEKNKKIEHQNEAITDSIRYAKRIQTAVLPDKQTSSLFEYFIYFVPKDIVSGDFYWIHHFEKQNRLIAVAADCTGHGVPGAFMSMLGTSFLNEIVAKLDVTHSDSILNILRDYVINTLSQGLKDGDRDERKDGMDLALVSIDLNTMSLEFSGANNPLILIRDNQLLEYKPDKMPIGAYVKQDIPFKRTEIKLKKDDVFYMFSDGYVDQFGGEHGRKYMKKRFKDFLFSIHKKPICQQKELLEKEMNEWIEGHEQIDDQIVLGMRVI